ELLNQPPARRSEREPHGHFTFARAATHEHEVRKIGARNQKHKPGDSQKQPERGIVRFTQRTGPSGSGIGCQAKMFVHFRALRIAPGRSGSLEEARAEGVELSGSPLKVPSGP